MRREQIAEILCELFIAEPQRSAVIDAILALDAATQDSCPVRDDDGDCLIHSYCQGEHQCTEWLHYIKQRIQSYHASRCRECKRPEEAVEEYKRKWRDITPDLDMSRRCEENREP